MTTNDPQYKINVTSGTVTAKQIGSGTISGNQITFHGNPNTTTGHTFTTSGAYINYGTQQSRQCSVCLQNCALLPQTECMFLGGFWFCNNDCRLEFIFRQLVRTDHIG